MITIKTPDRYINEPNILKSAGEYINKIGRNAVVIGGKTALTTAGAEFFSSLKESGVSYEVKEFSGHCTSEAIENYRTVVAESKADIVIGVGGGSVLDLVKAVGEKSNLPVVTIPTIAATCAAWSALTVLYDESGRQTGYLILNTSPKLILADTEILAAAPVRYLNAGIADTLVKWYEAAPYFNEGSNDFSLKVGLQTAKLALDILQEKGVLVAQEVENKNITQAFSEVVDSIIILAGLVGSINGGNHRAAVGHAIHNSLTSIPNTHDSLHGEKVIFGLIVQFILEGKPQEEIEELISFLNKLNLPVTLQQLGIKDDLVSRAVDIAEGVNITEEALDKLNFSVTKELIAEAVIKADRLGQDSLKLKSAV